MALRAPAPWLVRDEGLVGVEAGEVGDVGVVVLGRPAAGSGDEGRAALAARQVAGGLLAGPVLGTRDAGAGGAHRVTPLGTPPRASWRAPLCHSIE